MARDRHGVGRVVAVVGGGALLLWLLLRGNNWRLGLGDGGGSTGSGGGTSTTDGARDTAQPVRCHVWIGSRGLELDGKAASLDEVVTRCRAAGAADLTVTGAAIWGTFDEVRQALDAAGVRTYIHEPRPIHE